MNIIPNKLSLAQLFANNNEQFVVPSYQRRYSWKIQHTGALFDDIDRLKDDDGHLFGMIILHADAYNSGFMTPELVDGQQRLTSITLLLKSLEKAFQKVKREDTAAEIKKMLQCKGPDRIIKNKMILGDLDGSDYNVLMNEANLDEIENENLKYAVECFDYWLEDYEESDLDEFYHKLINIAVIIRLDVTNARDAYKLFETINNRGLRLSSTDIIKNFLLGHAAKIKDNDVLDDVKKIWAQIIKNLDGINTDDFFRQYFCSILKRKVSFNSLVTDFKRYYIKTVQHTDLLGEYETYKDEEVDEQISEDNEKTEVIEDFSITEDETISARLSIIEFLKLIRDASDIYRKMYWVKFDEAWINQHINNLWAIQCFPSFIFLMHFFQLEYSKKIKVKVLRMIESFMLRRHICEKKTGENDFIFAHLMHAFSTDTEANFLLKFKEVIHDYYPEDIEFEDKILTYQFKGSIVDRGRYILEQLEYEKRGNTEETVINLAEYVHLEHIIPQTIDTKKSISEFGNWIEYLGENSIVKHRKYVGRIGNLTLLAAPLNIQASNNPFTRKKMSYRQSDLQITKELASQSDFKFYHVDQRCAKIAKKAIEIWTVDFSDLKVPI